MRSVQASLAIALAMVAAIIPTTASADGAWLDGPTTWNEAGAALPLAPVSRVDDDPRCRDSERTPETAEDAAVAASGWRLFNEYQGGWGVKLVSGLAAYDGMCRPMAYQVFVFVDSAFAGTLSPEPMNSRTDGSLVDARLVRPGSIGDTITGNFNRYAATDALCCPSRGATARYRINRNGPTPVLELAGVELRNNTN